MDSDTANKLIEASKAFKEKWEKTDSDYFKNLNKGQSPPILWIGCADSRVDPTEILNMPPGSIFVQRNVANQVRPHDSDLMSVVEYAVIHLKVKTVVVCGHTNCGGINATAQCYGALEENLQKHLAPLKLDWESHDSENKGNPEDKLKMMYGKNAKIQVENLMKLDYVKKAVEAKTLEVLPMLFHLDTGLLSLVE